ncbi:hypothetical protein NE865_06270 [Phthorimaea operculella]|nr:hypothetical protein NE865_06270 [Phthorimaea operculella]
MEIPKLIILLSCIIYHSFASEHSHTIPVEHYDTELQDLGSHVESHDTPVKVIKITKTVAVKIPVPYPVKVIEKVPYPVHVSKPYPVPVPQIVHVPKHDEGHGNPHQEHQAIDAPHGFAPQQEGNQEEQYHGDGGDYSQHFGGGGNEGHFGGGGNEGHFGGGGNEGHSDGGFHGYAGDSGSYESKNYEQAINQYLHRHPSGGHNSNGYHYHH